MSLQDSTPIDAPADPMEGVSLPAGDEAVQASEDVDTGNEFDLFVTPANPEAEDRWPDLPARMPRSEAYSILHNTSLDERERLHTTSAQERPQPTPAQRQEQQRRVAAEIGEDRREEEAAAAAHQADIQREAGKEAEKAAKKLRELYERQQGLLDVYKSCRQQFEQQDPAGYARLQQHAGYAAVVTQENVCFHDYLRYFQQGPHHFSLALKNLTRCYHEQSRLRNELNQWERVAGNTMTRISQAQQESAAGAAIGFEGFGLETEPDMHILTLGKFVPRHFVSAAEEEAYIHAVFELRRVRLEHESSPQMRYPQCGPFEQSLDNSVRESLRGAYSHYYDENGQARRTISATLAATLAGMQTYANNLE